MALVNAFGALGLDVTLQNIRDEIGAISATPAANTVQDRLKGIKDDLDALVAASGGTGGATSANQVTELSKLEDVKTKLDAIITNTSNIILEADQIDLDVTGVEDRIGVISATPPANTLQDRLKGIKADLDTISTALAGTLQTDVIDKSTRLLGHVTVDSMPAITASADLEGDDSDLDSGAGTDDHDTVAIGLPGAGGHVVGGTSTNPFRTDPTGTTTQPVSAVSLPLPAGAATESTLSAIKTDVDKIPTSPSQEHATANSPSSVRLTDGSSFYKGTTPTDTQPISAASLPLPSGAATEATLSTINGKLVTAKTADYDTGAGTDTVQMTGIALPKSGGAVSGGTSTDPVRIDPTGTTTQPVSGTVTITPSGTQDENLKQVGGTTLLTGTGATGAGSQRVTVAQDSNTVAGASSLPTGSNTIGKVDQGTGGASAWKVDGSAVTQPVSGTVTANAGTNLNTSSLALDATLTAGSQKAIVRGGQKGTTNTNADITHSASGVNHEALDINIYDSSGNVLGLSATPLRTDPTGTTTQPVSGTVTITPSGTQDENLKQVGGNTVNTGTGAAGTGTQRVAVASDSSITANAGTNLNTSALALSATQTDRSQKSQITDGTRDGTVKAASTLPVGTDTAVVVTQRDGLPTGSNTIGAVTANAGTNLNTSALALETGGNLASVKTNTDNLTLAQESTTSGQKGNLILGAVTTSAPTYTTAKSDPLSLTTTGLLRIDGSGVTQPVSGTVTITPSGTQDENLKQVNTATVNVGTGTAGTGTQRVAVASDSSITANAGTNLNTSALALEAGGNLATVKTNTDNLTLAQASTTSGQKGNLILGATTTAAPSYTTAQTNPLSLTTTGQVRVDGSGSTQPVSGTVTTTPSGTQDENLKQVNSATVNVGTGTAGTGTQRVAVSSDSFPATQAISAASLPLPAGAATETTLSRLAGSLVPASYDYISLAYTGSDLTTVVFKSGGSGGSTIRTLALTYTSSVLQTVTAT